MQKKIVLLIIIVIILNIIILGCEKVNDLDINETNNEEIIQEDIENNIQNNIENTDFNNYENVFKSVLNYNQTKDKYDIQRINYSGEIISLIDNDNIICIHNQQLVRYNIITEKASIIEDNIWNARPSIDGTLIVYESNNGIKVYKTHENKTIHLFKLKTGEITRNIIISDDNKYLLIQSMDNNNIFSEIINITNGDIRSIDIKENNDFMMNELIFYKNNKLFAIVKINKLIPGTTIIDSVNDLISIDLSNGKVKKITDLSPGDDLFILDIVYSEEILYKTTENIKNEEVTESKHSEILFNITKNKKYKAYISSLSYLNVINMLTHDKYIYLKKSANVNPKYPEMQQLIYNNDKDEEVVAEIYTDIPNNIFINKDGNKILFNSNEDIYVINMKDLD